MDEVKKLAALPSLRSLNLEGTVLHAHVMQHIA